MPVFLCRWPNGDFSVVHAANRDQAVEFLDEVDNAEDCPVKVIKEFMIHFRLADDGEFILKDFGEMTPHHIRRLGYPVLDKALSDAATDEVGEWTEEGRKTIRQAVDKERERLLPDETKQRGKQPKTLVGGRIKAELDMPTKMIDRIVEKRAEEVLKKFKGKGKPN